MVGIVVKARTRIMDRDMTSVRVAGETLVEGVVFPNEAKSLSAASGKSPRSFSILRRISPA